MKDEEFPDLLAVDRLAGMLKVSKTTVYRIIERRAIPFYRIGRTVRFNRQEVLAYLRDQRVEAMAERRL